MRAYYYANVEMIDTSVGEIMQALERNGYMDDTVVIFTSDHGDCLGDHGLSQKWSMYDVVTRVPLIVWAPQRFRGGRSVDDLVQLFDLGPTILDLAGVASSADMEAQSLLPALTEQAYTPRQQVFCEQAGDMVMTGADFITMVRETRWKLVHLLGCDEGQLFDLEADPDERHNLWHDPAHAAEKTRLKDTLLEWLVASNFKTRDHMAEFR